MKSAFLSSVKRNEKEKGGEAPYDAKGEQRMEGMTFGELFRTLLSALCAGCMLTVLIFFLRFLFSAASLLPKTVKAAFSSTHFSFRRKAGHTAFFREDAHGAPAFLYDFLTVFSGGILFLLFSYAVLSGVFRFYALFFFLFGFAVSFRLTEKAAGVFFSVLFPALCTPISFSVYGICYAAGSFFRLCGRFLFRPILRCVSYRFGRLRHPVVCRRKKREMREYLGNLSLSGK